MQKTGLLSPLPSALSNLKNLRDLDLSNNNFDGNFPTSIFSSMENLQNLNLAVNGFTGPFPTDVLKRPLDSLLLIYNYFDEQPLAISANDIKVSVCALSKSGICRTAAQSSIKECGIKSLPLCPEFCPDKVK